VLSLLFFVALTGMRTGLDFLRGANMWFLAAAVLVVAVAGRWEVQCWTPVGIHRGGRIILLSIVLTRFNDLILVHDHRAASRFHA
jgi:hypothetical protein